MRGFIDLHSHFVANIDDGAPSLDVSLAMLRALRAIGFDTVIATPHMRPELFDNDRPALEAAYEQTRLALATEGALPATGLGCEHFFDEVVYRRLLEGRALPYPGGRAALIEFHGLDFPPALGARLFDVQRQRLLPVIAHPERYRCFWQRTDELERLVDAGCALLLDTAALVGKYGREPQRAAERLLELELYHAACSDAHRPADADAVALGMARIEDLYGPEELDFLFKEGPSALLEGRLPDAS
jgi:protein-tyrosine phosphatase